jgi:hypothetical protein
VCSHEWIEITKQFFSTSPTELYAKIAEKFRRETAALQTAATGLPATGSKMKKVRNGRWTVKK